MRCDNRDKSNGGEPALEYVEVTVGQEKFAANPQSHKKCEESTYFDRDLATDTPCGLCYESEDKYEWTRQGDIRPGEVAFPNDRVCEGNACSC
jgi:hypothetical protein